jgi:uncharacterized protein YbjT (DUF2867 family)
MGDSRKILVTGATGNIGSLLIPQIVESGAGVRAFVRDAAKGDALSQQGIDVIKGDLNDPESLALAVDGVDTVFTVLFNGPDAVAHGRNIISAAKKAGVRRIVKISGHGSSKSRIIADHDVLDAELVQSGLSYTIVKPTFFMQNAMMAAQTIASDGVFYLPLGDGRLGMIDIRDVADAAHAVLTSDGHDGQTYVLTGPTSVSMNDLAKAFSSALNREVSYVAVPPEAARESMLGMGLPEWTVDGFIELMVEFARNWGDGVTDNVERLTGHEARTIDRFAEDFAEVFGGSASALAR